MSRGSPFVTEIVEFNEDGSITVYGVGKPKRIEVPHEVVEWLRNSTAARRILEELITHYKFRSRLSHPGAIRSLLLLLYARAQGIAPYKIAKKFGVAPEQLYRIERGLRKDGLYDLVLNLLSLEAQPSKP